MGRGADSLASNRARPGTGPGLAPPFAPAHLAPCDTSIMVLSSRRESRLPVLDSVFYRHRPAAGYALRRSPIVASVSLEDRAELPITPDMRPVAPARASALQAPTDGQLALQIPSELPNLEIEPEWKDQQRLWAHSFHPMCSYLASFPASLVHAFIARYSRPGDVVLDPFSGRGTTPLQACAEGRIGVGNDLNPFAHILTAAKVDPPTKADVRTRGAVVPPGLGGGGT